MHELKLKALIRSLSILGKGCVNAFNYSHFQNYSTGGPPLTEKSPTQFPLPWFWCIVASTNRSYYLLFRKSDFLFFKVLKSNMPIFFRKKTVLFVIISLRYPDSRNIEGIGQLLSFDAPCY